ncbi:MAG: hypothetical protein H6Q69_2695 [Firmicutes bacterium]|nr:hypothetical protein [Bacillota bacterium]
MNYKICIVAPFANLAQTAKEVIRERSSEWEGEIEVVTGDLQDGVEEARNAIDRGAEAIISRGGTALRIEKQIRVPMVQIGVGAIDIFRTLKQVGLDSSAVGIAGYNNVIYECEALAELLGIPICMLTTASEVEASNKIEKAAKSGIEIVFGDHNAVKLAIANGLRGVVIETGKDAIYKAIREAELLIKVRRREQEHAELLRTVVEMSHDGIVAVDHNSKVTLWNSSIANFFQTSSGSAVGRSIEDVIPNTCLPNILDTGEKERGEIFHFGQKAWAVTRLPIKINNKIVGAIANVQDVTKLQSYERIIRQKLHGNGLVAKVDLNHIIGSSPVIEKVKQQAKRYAQTSSTVLITGESGTGKEMFAQAIHRLSQRKGNPFVAVNCGALPESLLESELLGYEEGAFTGAKKGGKTGLFELAHEGTLFLDEIGEMPISLQNKLLRVLQEKEVMRLGGYKVIPVDVRVIAATNQNLTEQIELKKFRLDLYYRLDVLRLHLPPLRERQGDIPLLTNFFLAKLNEQNQRNKRFDFEALQHFAMLPWTGNIRELMNVIERLWLLSDSEEISVEEIEQILPAVFGGTRTGNDLKDIERQRIEQILREENFSYARTAKRLGINRTTLWRKLKKQE